jgi:hypothetical protein
VGVSYFLWASFGCALAGGSLWVLGLYFGAPKVSPEQIAEARKLKRIMEELKAEPGWKKLVEYAEAQTQDRTNRVLLLPTSQPYEQEYMKGEVQGIKIFLNIPDTLIEQAKGIAGVADEDDEDES